MLNVLLGTTFALSPTHPPTLQNPGPSIRCNAARENLHDLQNIEYDLREVQQMNLDSFSPHVSLQHPADTTTLSASLFSCFVARQAK